MTDKGSISELRYMASELVSFRHRPLSNVESESLERAVNALNNKSEAEEYRTPKKIVHYEFTDGSIDDVCPTCSHILLPHFTDFCMHCGQALDWNWEVKEPERKGGEY